MYVDQDTSKHNSLAFFAGRHGRSERPQIAFAYNITFKLLDPDQQIATWPATAGPPRVLKSVQLKARHWIFTDATGKADEVRHTYT